MVDGIPVTGSIFTNLGHQILDRQLESPSISCSDGAFFWDQEFDMAEVGHSR